MGGSNTRGTVVTKKMFIEKSIFTITLVVALTNITTKSNTSYEYKIENKEAPLKMNKTFRKIVRAVLAGLKNTHLWSFLKNLPCGTFLYASSCRKKKCSEISFLSRFARKKCSLRSQEISHYTRGCTPRHPSAQWMRNFFLTPRFARNWYCTWIGILPFFLNQF